MDGDKDGAVQEKRPQEDAQGEPQQAAQAQVTGVSGKTAGDGAGEAEQARAEYEAALAERDAKIAALEGEIAEAAKIAESAERLRAEMDELRRRGEEQRIGFELQMAGCRSVKAARALLDDHGGDGYRQDSCALSDSLTGPPSGTATHPAESRPGSAGSPRSSPQRT